MTCHVVDDSVHNDSGEDGMEGCWRRGWGDVGGGNGCLLEEGMRDVRRGNVGMVE